MTRHISRMACAEAWAAINASFALVVSPPTERKKSRRISHHLHLFLQTAVLAALFSEFRGLGPLPPDCLDRAYGHHFKLLALGLRWQHAEFLGDARLRGNWLRQARYGLLLELGSEVAAGLSAHLGSFSRRVLKFPVRDSGATSVCS